jgi:ribosomal protein S12 methylthiotransferase accessory factor
VRLAFISGARDDLGVSRCYAAFRDPAIWRLETERMRSGPPVRRFQDVPTFTGRSFDEDVAWELARLEAAGLWQAVRVDRTRPEFGISVVWVVVPGLEAPHDAPGFVPGSRGREKLKERVQCRSSRAAENRKSVDGGAHGREG